MSSTGQDRLKRAVNVYLREIVEKQRSPDDVLRDHGELRDLLEPMIEEDGASERIGEPDVSDLDVPNPHDDVILDDFRVEREIGRGGMGVVYEAHQISLQRKVALKVLRAERSAKPEALVRFRREAASIASLDHPGIVGVHATGMARDTCYIAMDLVVGAPLDAILRRLRDGVDAPEPVRIPTAVVQWLRDRDQASAASLGARNGTSTPGSWAPTTVGQVATLIAQIADALAHAHDRGVIHRDVKPANILIRPDGTAVLTDFGLSQLSDSSPVTVTGGLSGTVYYLAPEQIERSQSVDGRADVFALGVTLYELLTLHRPFDGETTGQVLRAIVAEQPAVPQGLNPQLTADLVAIIGKAIEKDPSQRYQSAGEFAADLRAFLAYRPIRARQPGPLQRAVRWVRREPVRATLAALLVVAVLGLAGFAGYLVARQPELAAGAAALRTTQLEEMLTNGFLEYGEGSRARAGEHFRRAFAFAPDSPEALTGLALTAQSERGPGAGLDVIDRADPALNQRRPIQRLRLHMLRDADRNDEATQLAAVLGPPTETLEFYVEGLREIELGHDGDRQAFVRGVDHLHRAILLSERPRPVFYFQWAHAVGHTSDRETGELCVATLERFWPDSWKTWFWIRFVWYEKEPERALAAARKAAAMQPDNASVLYSLSMVELDSERAERACRRVHQLEPNWVPAMVRMADLRTRQGDPEGSAEWLERASAIRPGHAAVHRGRGLSLLRRGNAEAAAAQLERAVVADPKDAMAHFYLGRARHAQNDIRAAVAAYEACVKVAPNNAEALTNWANILRHSGQFSEAEGLYRRAIATRPGLPQPREGMHHLLVAEQRMDELQQHLDTWVEALPDDLTAWWKRGLFRWEFGPGTNRDRSSSALPDLEKAASLPGGEKKWRLMFALGCVQTQVGDYQRGEVSLLRATECATGADAAQKKLIATRLAQCRQALAAQQQQESKR